MFNRCWRVATSSPRSSGRLRNRSRSPSSYALPMRSFHVSGPQVTFDPLAKLAPKADAVYRVKVRGMQPGDYRFRVQMTCEQLRQPVMKEEASRVYKDGQ